MATVISGSDGITLEAGKNLKYSATSYITPENNVSGAEVSTAGVFTVKTGTTTPAERLRVDNFGNVGIGTNLPNSKLEVSNEIDISMGAGANGHVSIEGAGYGFGIALDSAGANLYTNSTARSIILGTNETERMRIDGSGNVLMGTTTPVNATSRLASHCQSGGISLETKSASDGYYPAIFYNTAGNAAGYIWATSTATTYATSSDYRLKELDVPMTGATERVKALRPINFAWKVDGSRVDGFFAHELAEVVPEAATGTKDAMRDEEYEVTPATETEAAVMATRSVPDYQGIDQSKLVPLLTATLQELIARVEALEGTV